MQRRYILSIDGGGVRGIIPALALVKLEQTTNRPARETFSFVAGTSTGALLASAVAAGIPAETIVRIYKTRLKDIFKPGPPWSAVRRYTAGYMYDSANLNRVLREEFGSLAAWRLNDSPIDILLTATGLADGKPWYFVRDNPRNAGSTGNLSLLDCATASAAAPTYFDPWLMPAPVAGKLVDGGVGVTGNPVRNPSVGRNRKRTQALRRRGQERILARAGPVGYSEPVAEPAARVISWNCLCPDTPPTESPSIIRP
jgi:patatin-like phospholipase/acyl hydrolase